MSRLDYRIKIIRSQLHEHAIYARIFDVDKNINPATYDELKKMVSEKGKNNL